MDNEKERRAELIAALDPSFECFEEVPLQHATFPQQIVRADVIAIARDGDIAGYPLAFEVKEIGPVQYKEWCWAIRQASDYVYGTVQGSGVPKRIAGRRVIAAFIFPSPIYDASGRRTEHDPHSLPGDRLQIVGMFNLALHFRVGRAFAERRGKTERFALAFGPNTVWDAENGFRKQGFNLLKGQRSIGSGRMDVGKELDGWD